MNRRCDIRRIAAHGVRGSVIAATLVLAGCYEHSLARRETISVHGGNAAATNNILQTVHPWPAKAWDKQIDHDGTRMVNAIDAYHDPDGGESSVTDAITSLTTDDGDTGSETTD